MPGEWRRADEEWDNHPDAFWNDAFAAAKREGWQYRSMSSHRLGEVRCPTGEHSQKVDSSSKWSETKSKDLLKLIERNCSHGTRSSSRLLLAREHIDHALELVDAAEEGLDLIGAAAEADGKLAAAERLELLLDTAGANVEDIIADRDALLAEAAAGPDAPPTEAVLALAEQAQERIRQARSELKQLSVGLRKPLMAEASDASERAAVVRAQLEP